MLGLLCVCCFSLMMNALFGFVIPDSTALLPLECSRLAVKPQTWRFQAKSVTAILNYPRISKMSFSTLDAANIPDDPLETRNLAADLAKSRLLVNERDETIRMLQEELQMTAALAKIQSNVISRDDTIRMLQLQLKMAHAASDMMSPPLVPVEAALPRSIPPLMQMEVPGIVNPKLKPSHALNATPSARVLPLSPPIVSIMPVDVDVTVLAALPCPVSPCEILKFCTAIEFRFIAINGAVPAMILPLTPPIVSTMPVEVDVSVEAALIRSVTPFETEFAFLVSCLTALLCTRCVASLFITGLSALSLLVMSDVTLVLLLVLTMLGCAVKKSDASYFTVLCCGITSHEPAFAPLELWPGPAIPPLPPDALADELPLPMVELCCTAVSTIVSQTVTLRCFAPAVLGIALDIIMSQKTAARQPGLICSMLNCC